MLRSLYQGQQIIIQDLHRLSLHLQMDPPLTTLEAYRQQVAWPGDQPSNDRGKGLLEPPLLRILQLMRTSWLTWLALIGAHGQIWEAAHDTSFILCFVLCFLFMFYVLMFY